MNSTTTARFKAYAGITGTAQDAQIALLITMVSDQLKQFLECDIEATTYHSWLNGTGGEYMHVPNWPITRVYQCSVTSVNVARLSNTAATTSRAGVGYDGTSFSLMSISSSGTETLTDLAVATYKVLSTLETAVELVSGWDFILSDSSYGAQPTNFIRPIPARDALTPEYADISMPDAAESVKLIGDDMIEVGCGFPYGMANVFLWYKAGYVLPTDSVDGTLPAGLLLLVNQLVMDSLTGIKSNSNFQSESLGDYSYSRAAVASAIENRKKDLVMYRKPRI